MTLARPPLEDSPAPDPIVDVWTDDEERYPGCLHPKHIPTRLVADGEVQLDQAYAEGGFESRPVLRSLARLLALYTWRRMMRRYDPIEFGQRMRQVFEELGGVWVKLAQLIALRKDLFGTEFCGELGRLHDRASAFPGELARRVVEEDLRLPLDVVFSEFSTEPVAAASIGQCHVARLRETGQRVAVKVQRPEAQTSFLRDVQLIRRLFKPFHWFGIAPHIRWNDFVWEIENIVNEELDYRFELNSLRRIRKNLRDAKKVYVPRAFPKWCSRRVLVMEYVEGVFMSDFLAMADDDPDRLAKWCQDNGVKGDAVGRRLYTTFLRMLLEDNFFHGDLHPGNILLLKNGWVCLIDFGTVSRVDEKLIRSFNQFLAHVSRHDFTKAINSFLNMADSLPAIDLEELKSSCLGVLKAWDRRTRIKSIPYARKSTVALWGEIGQVVMKYRITMDWTFLRVDRATVTLDVSLQQLFPNMNFPKELDRFFRGHMERLTQRAKTPEARAAVFAQWSELIEMIPENMPNILGDVSRLVGRQARNFRATTTKIAFLAEMILRQGRAFLTVLVLFGAITWGHQRGVLTFMLDIEGSLDDFLAAVPILTNLEWIAIVGSLCWFHRVATMLINRFGRPEPSAGPRAGTV